MIGLYGSLFILLLFVIPLCKYDTSKDVFIVWGLYFLSTLLACWFDPSSIDGFGKAESYEEYIFVFYAIMVCYALSPLYAIRSKSMRPILTDYKFNKHERWFIWILIIGAVYSIIYTVPYAVKSIGLGAHQVRRVALRDADVSVLPKTIWTTVAVAFATFFSIYLSLFFMAIKSNLRMITKVLLLVSSLSYVVSSLAYTARDGLLFFMLFSVIFLTVYWSWFNPKLQRSLTYVLIFLFSAAFYFLADFTVDRWGDSSSTGIMSYVATQPYVFAENFTRRDFIHEEDFYGLGLRFPLLSDIFGGTTLIERSEPYEWTFGTFLTDFYNVSGLTSLMFFTIAFTEFFRFQFRISRNHQMRFSICYIFYIHFIVSGLFYFRLGSFSGNIFILLLIIALYAYRKWKF